MRTTEPSWLVRIGNYSLPIYLMHYGFLCGSFVWLQPRLAPLLGAGLAVTLAALASLPAALVLPILVSRLVARVTPYARYLGMVA